MEPEDWQCINVAKRLAVIVTPAENVGNRTVAEIDIDIGLEASLTPIGPREARLVNGEIKRATLEKPANARTVDVVLTGRTVAFGLAILKTQQEFERVVRPQGEGRANNGNFVGAMLGIVELVGEPAFVITVIDRKLGRDVLGKRAGDHTRCNPAQTRFDANATV